MIGCATIDREFIKLF